MLTQVTGSLGELRQRPSGLPLLSGRGGKGGGGPGKRNRSVARLAVTVRTGEDDDENEGPDDDDHDERRQHVEQRDSEDDADDGDGEKGEVNRLLDRHFERYEASQAVHPVDSALDPTSTIASADLPSALPRGLAG